jgi:hypothetical protein
LLDYLAYFNSVCAMSQIIPAASGKHTRVLLSPEAADQRHIAARHTARPRQLFAVARPREVEEALISQLFQRAAIRQRGLIQSLVPRQGWYSDWAVASDDPFHEPPLPSNNVRHSAGKPAPARARR